MMRLYVVALLAVVAASLTGCYAGPCGSHCDSCEGVAPGPQYAHQPFEQFRDVRKSMLCGNGCGEVYYGEWRSYPPDCCDPCDNAVQCTPPVCWRPFMVARMLSGLYGKRYPRGYHDDCYDVCCDDCVVGDCCDSGCGCSDCGETVYQSQPVESAGCSSCTPSVIGNTPQRVERGRGVPYRRDNQTGSSTRTIRR